MVTHLFSSPTSKWPPMWLLVIKHTDNLNCASGLKWQCVRRQGPPLNVSSCIPSKRLHISVCRAVCQGSVSIQCRTGPTGSCKHRVVSCLTNLAIQSILILLITHYWVMKEKLIKDIDSSINTLCLLKFFNGSQSTFKHFKYREEDFIHSSNPYTSYGQEHLRSWGAHH